jgi:hypothetical protein
MNRVLQPKGYQRRIDDSDSALGKAYTGFWRRAEADGVWTKAGAPVQHLALESKLTEDAEAPLCQVVDHLAHLMSDGSTGGIVYVRVHRAGHEPAAPSPALKRLEEAWLVRYLDITLGT